MYDRARHDYRVPHDRVLSDDHPAEEDRVFDLSLYPAAVGKKAVGNRRIRAVEGRNLVPYSGIHRRLRAEDGISDVFVLHHQAVAVILKYRAVLQHKAVEAVHTDGKRAAVEALLDEIAFEMVKSLCRKRGDGLNKRVAAYHVHSESRILPLPRGIVQVNAVGSASVGGIDDKLGGGRLVLRSRRCDDCHVPAGFRVRIDDLSEINAAYRVGVGEDHIIGIFLLKEGECGAELLDFPAIAPGISRRKGRNEHKSAALAVEIPVLTGAEMVYQRLIVVFRDDPDVVYSGVDHVGEDKIYLTVSPGEGERRDSAVPCQVIKPVVVYSRKNYCCGLHLPFLLRLFPSV